MTTVTLPTAAALIEEAAAATGLADFGPGDFREGLAIFLDSVSREAGLSPAATEDFLATIRRRLVNRLEVEAWYAAHPEVDAVPVGPSVFIVGLPRTGTTALTHMLSLDHRLRCLRSWEQLQPCPPPVLGEDRDDPRRLAAVERNRMIAQARPDLMAMHLFDADSTDEDVEVLGMNFHAQQGLLPIPTYHAWWRTCDMRPTYAYHRRIAQLLQSRRPPVNWLFKAPAHLYHIDALVSAYPDARILMTHRDPVKAIPSAISINLAMQPEDVRRDPVRHGLYQAEHLRIGVERAMVAREALGEGGFFDVHHLDLIKDPFGMLARIYDFLGMELIPDVLAKVRAWHETNRSGAHGAHRYTAQEFGLDPAKLRAEYRDYTDRFGIRLEA